MRGSIVLGASLLAAAVGVRSASAQDLTLNQVAIHGYGAWSYGRTENGSPNMFLFGHDRGDYSHVEFALNLSANLTDRLVITAQPFWHAGHHANQTSSGVDYVFGEWKFSDAMRFRVGSVKQPFGIYTEIFDVNTLRPFGALPQGVYGPAGMVGKAYSGMGLTGVKYAASGWGVGYDLYGGGLEVNERDVALQVLVQGPDTTGKTLNLAETRTFRNVYGGRFILYTPINGLSVGVSGYAGSRPLGTTEVHRSVYGAHAEFLNDRWSVRSELAREEDDVNDRSIDGAYAEAAFRVTDSWQIAGLYSMQRTTLPGVDVSQAPTLLDHDEWGAGLNYWFSPNLAVKTSYHFVDGNRFAAPDQPLIRRAVALGTMNETTHVVLVGGALSF
jgi:hypothetical protein